MLLLSRKGLGGWGKDYKPSRNLVDWVIIMETFKDTIVAIVADRAIQRAGILSRQLLKAKPEQREAITAGIRIEKELADTCRLSLEPSIID